MKLDEIHWKILFLVQKDARLSYAEIGKRIGLSAPAVAERLKKLEEGGIIRGYHAQVDPDFLGLTFMGIVNIQNTKRDSAKIIQLAKEIPEVLSCDVITGSNNYVIRVAATSRGHFSRVINQFLEHGLTTSSIVLDRPVVFKPISIDTLGKSL
ncbi:MAG: Lrp/AsnC family transcriptional regulator [Chloroflexota bacterium]